MKIWRAHVPQKIKIFLWKMCHNILLVKYNLKYRRIATTDTCPICQQEPETIEHALLLCSWTRPVWFGLQLGFTLHASHITSLKQWFEERIEDIEKLPDVREIAFMSMCCVVWGIWKTRNAFLFERVSPNPIGTLIQIRGMVDDYASLIPKGNATQP